jgi:hypothetical protein
LHRTRGQSETRFTFWIITDVVQLVLSNKCLFTVPRSRRWLLGQRSYIHGFGGIFFLFLTLNPIIRPVRYSFMIGFTTSIAKWPTLCPSLWSASLKTRSHGVKHTVKLWKHDSPPFMKLLCRKTVLLVKLICAKQDRTKLAAIWIIWLICH